MQDCKLLAAYGYRWSLPGSQPHISRAGAESITELAFLRSCIAWEAFLEESFILYFIGRSAPRGHAPRRFAFPPSRRAAEEWVKEGRNFASWSEPSVIDRARRFFRNGSPFIPALRSRQNGLDEMRTIRNAIVHGSGDCRKKFETLARNKLGTLPPRLKVGGFLNHTANPNPPQSFLESYLGILETVAQQIVPS